MDWTCRILSDNSVEIYFKKHLFSFTHSHSNMSFEDNITKSIEHISSIIADLPENERYTFYTSMNMLQDMLLQK